MMALESLPAPLPGHVRVFRVECMSNPRIGGAAGARAAVDPISGKRLMDIWVEELPTPWLDNGLWRNPRHEEHCACDARWVDRWWPDWARQYLASEGLHMVALDVPDSKVAKGDYQYLIERAAAQVVAVLH